MDWRILLDRIKVSRFIVLFIAALAIIGFLLAAGADGNFVSAALVYLLGVFISHAAAVGFRISGNSGKVNIKWSRVLERAVTFAAFALFGYRFAQIFHYSACSILIYIVLWGAYLKYKKIIMEEPNSI